MQRMREPAYASEVGQKIVPDVTRKSSDNGGYDANHNVVPPSCSLRWGVKPMTYSIQ